MVDALIWTRGGRHPFRPIGRRWPADGQRAVEVRPPTGHDSQRGDSRLRAKPATGLAKHFGVDLEAPSSRVVAIAGIDKQADSAPHVESTGEIGRLRVV